MESQLTFTHEVLICCILYNRHDYYLTLLVIYECLNILKNDLALMAVYYILHPAQPEEDLPPLRAWFLSRFFPRFLPFYHSILQQKALPAGCVCGSAIGDVHSPGISDTSMEHTGHPAVPVTCFRPVLKNTLLQWRLLYPGPESGEGKLSVLCGVCLVI